MSGTFWRWWVLQWLGIVLLGGGLLAIGLALSQRTRRNDDCRDGVETDVGIPGNLPAAPGINIARVRVGGDIGGLVAVIGLFLVFLPSLWGPFLAAGIGAGLVAVMFFLWHRYHPW
jgi:hypothetical protein